MKIFVLAPKENWSWDRFNSEWQHYQKHMCVDSPDKAEIIWLLADWCWNQIDQNILKSKKVVATVHHIAQNKFDEKKLNSFKERDFFVDFYHVPCEKTANQVRALTNKPVFVFPFWVNQNIWINMRNKKLELRKKYGLPENKFLIGSFQRDTEGHDLISPKLEKGPDLFCDAVQRFNEKRGDVEVLLAGWRRQYVMKRLSDVDINFYYAELPSFEIINELYNCLDLYVVAARYEGGPQAIVECSATNTPIISTDVGLASHFLPKKSIFIPGKELTAEPDPKYCYDKVKVKFIENGFSDFKDMFKTIVEKN